MMRGMSSKGIFESRSGSRERGAIWQNIADNLNNLQKFAVAAPSLRDHLTTLTKNYELKTRQEVRGIGLKGEELSENEQLHEDIIGRFEKSERRTEADTQKRLFDIKNKKKKAQKKRKKSNGKIWRDKHWW